MKNLTSASGRKRTLKTGILEQSERLLLRKADIQDQGWKYRKSTGWGTSAVPAKADIGLELVKWSANDPKRTLVTCPQFAIQLLYLGHLNTDKTKPA
jgi:hypothetical protein